MTVQTLMESLADLILGAQMELAIFFIAIVTHSFIFGKWSARSRSTPKQKIANGKLSTVAKLANGKEARAPPSQPACVGQLARHVRLLGRDNADQAALTAVFIEHLPKSSEEASSALIGLFETVLKVPTAAQLSALRSALCTRKLKLDGRLGEFLLRGYLSLHQKSSFDETLAEIEASGSALSPTAGVLALRAAIQASDFTLALDRLPKIAPAWKAATDASPITSAAPVQLIQQLAHMSARESKTTALLDALRACGLLMLPWASEALLAEASLRGDEASLRDIEECARKEGAHFSAGAYNVLIRSTASAVCARRLVDEAIERGLTQSVLATAAERATALQDVTFAKAVLGMLPSSPPAEVVAAAIRLAADGPLAAKGKAADDVVLELFEHRLAPSVNVLADFQAGRIVAEAALRQKRQDLLQRLLKASGDASPKQVYLLKSFGSDRRLADAYAVFEACPEKNTCLFNAILDACIDGQDLAGAERTMAQAVNAGAADVITYNTMIKALLQNHDTKAARKVMESMTKAGLSPNCVTFNEILDSTIRCNHGVATWDLVEEMKACGLKPNQVTCSILLKSIQRPTRSEDIERTLAVVDTLDEAMDEVLLSSVCEALIRANRPDLLTEQLKRARGVGAKPVIVRGAHTYGSIIRAYGAVNDLEGVWSTWREMRTRHLVPTAITLGCMVEALVKNDGPEAGYGLIQDVRSDPLMKPLLNAVIYCSVLKGFSHQKLYSRVWDLHNEMLEGKLQYSVITYNTLIDACARSGEMVKVQKLLDDMAKQRIEANVITYSTILKGYCNENRIDKAFELLKSMKDTKDFMPDEITYNSLLDGCARHGYYDKGMSVLQDMEKNGVKPSNFTLSVIVKMCSRSRKPEKAFDLCEQLCKKYNLRLNVHVYNNLINNCTTHQGTGRAFEVLDRMLDEGVRPDARTYTVLLRGCVVAGEGLRAASLLRAAAGLPCTAPTTLVALQNKVTCRGLQPRGVPVGSDVVSEVFDNISSTCGDTTIAVQLLQDLQKARSNCLQLDPRLRQRIAAQALKENPHHR